MPAADPPIDCFYVYPTASRSPQDYADIGPEPAVIRTVRAQAGRLAAACRLFVPFYRQATLYHLHHHPGHDWDGPDRDLAAAWDDYLANDNHGRGVVIVGHSQGTILLQRLIATKIDGTPAQARLVSAFLVGDPGFEVPAGRPVGGTFRHIPLCGAVDATGCAWTWASYPADAEAPRAFGISKGGLDAACINPAAPGGAGLLDAYLPRGSLPIDAAQPFIHVSGQIAAECRTDHQGAFLRVTIPPGPHAAELQTFLAEAAVPDKAKDWGLHRVDIALAQGTILRIIDAESRAWRSGHD